MTCDRITCRAAAAFAVRTGRYSRTAGRDVVTTEHLCEMHERRKAAWAPNNLPGFLFMNRLSINTEGSV